MLLPKKTYNKEILAIIEKGDFTQVRQLFAITDDNTHLIAKKFDLWAKTLFPGTFKSDDAEFHYDMNQNLADLYLGKYLSLGQIHFRGATKTTRTKLFIAFVLANDQRDSRRRYIKILSEDNINSTQMVTDVYNVLVSPKVKQYYPHLFRKTNQKREERMGSFSLATGVKILASTVGVNQRGHMQGEDNTRPDWLIFEDFETSLTIQSLVTTKKIWLNMEEAWNGREKGGVGLYNCNYISKRRNVQKIIDRSKKSPTIHKVHIVPIDDRKNRNTPGNPTWEARYSKSDIAQIEKDADDFDGEYLCNPLGSIDSYFAEDILLKHPTMQPILETKDGWTYLFKKDPTHTYILGIDPAGGTGGNFATIVVIDYTLRMVCAFYRSRWTQPDKLAEIAIEKGRLYNNALLVPEINYQGFVIIKMIKDANYPNVYIDTTENDSKDKKRKENMEEPVDKLGFTTSTKTKPMILSNLSTAVKNFHLIIPSEVIKNEMIEFPREYVELVKADDEELGHFDLTLATAIAWEGREQIAKKLFVTKYK